MEKLYYDSTPTQHKTQLKTKYLSLSFDLETDQLTTGNLMIFLISTIKQPLLSNSHKAGSRFHVVMVNCLYAQHVPKAAWELLSPGLKH